MDRYVARMGGVRILRNTSEMKDRIILGTRLMWVNIIEKDVRRNRV